MPKQLFLILLSLLLLPAGCNPRTTSSDAATIADAQPPADGQTAGKDAASDGLIRPDTAPGDLPLQQNTSSLRFEAGNAVLLNSFVASNPSLVTFTQPLTVELWARQDTSVPGPTLQSSWTLVEQGSSTGRVHFRIRLIPGLICESVDGDIVRAQVGTNLGDGKWHHVACSSDGSKLQLLVDGVVQQTLNLSLSIAAKAPAFTFLGNTIPAASTSFVGWIDELRIWKRYRDPATIASQMKLSISGALPDLVACWNMQEGSGDQLADSCGSSTPASVDQSNAKAPSWSNDTPF